MHSEKFILTLLFSTLLLSCSNKSSINDPSDSNSSYFPLSLGNTWAFNSHTETISDTATIRGKLYYGLTRGLSSSPGYWFRTSGDSVFAIHAYVTNDTADGLVYNFAANVGDTLTLPLGFACSYGNKVILATKNDTVSIPAGTYTDCYHFVHLSYCSDAGMIESWFARGIGRIKYIEESYIGIHTYILNSFTIE